MNHPLVIRLITGFAWLSGLAFVSSICWIVGFLIFKGLGSLNLALIFGDTHWLDAVLLRRQVFDGLLPAIIGTILLVGLSVSIAVPVGLGAGIYLAEYCSRRLKMIFSFFFDILAGVPSIVVGLFGFSVAIFLHKYVSERIFPCLIISSLSLAFLVLPYLIRTTQISLENLPSDMKRTAPALGATKLQNIFYVLIPRSLPGIVSGVILAIGRCAEDTAVIMLTGVVATAGVPKSLFANYEALPFYIYFISSQYADKQELSRGYGAAIILMIICALLFMTAFFIKHKISEHALHRL